jgi:hypothetical protein
MRNAVRRHLEGRKDFSRATLSEVEDGDSRTMNEREFSVVKIIAITGEKNVTIAERVGGVVLVGMTSQPGILDGHDLRAEATKHSGCEIGEVFVGVKAHLRSTPQIIHALADLRLGRRLSLHFFGNVYPTPQRL